MITTRNAPRLRSKRPTRLRGLTSKLVAVLVVALANIVLVALAVVIKLIVGIDDGAFRVLAMIVLALALGFMVLLLAERYLRWKSDVLSEVHSSDDDDRAVTGVAV